MKRVLSVSLAIFGGLCLMLGTEHRAYAYIDPGTGFMALQSLFAGLAAFSYVMRRKIAAFFGRNKSAGSVVMPLAVVQKDNERNAA